MVNIQFSYQMTEKDFYDYSVFRLYEKKKRWMIKLPLLLLMTYLLFLYILMNPNIYIIGLFVLLTTIILSSLVFIPLLLRIYTKRYYQNNTHFKHINEYHITQEAIHVKTNGEKSVISWDDLEEVKESRMNIYCIFSKEKVLFIPKTKINVESFLHFLKSKKPNITYHLIKTKGQSK